MVSVPLPHLQVGGRTKYFLSEWYKITKDPFIIQCVKGCHLNLTDFDFIKPKHEIPMSPDELLAGDEEIRKLKEKNAIVTCQESPVQCISNVFLTPKKDGGYRMILNLKSFNDYFVKHKFKMETIDHILAATTENCFMTIVDLSDAYLTLPVSSLFWPYLKF